MYPLPLTKKIQRNLMTKLYFVYVLELILSATMAVNGHYITSHEGLMNGVQMMLSIVTFSCVQASTWCTQTSMAMLHDNYCKAIIRAEVYRFFLAITMLSFIFVLLVYCIYLAKLHEKFQFHVWLLTLIIISTILMILLLLASSVLAANTAGLPGITAGVLLGFLTAGTFGGYMYMLFTQFQSKKPKNENTDVTYEIDHGNTQPMFSNHDDDAFDQDVPTLQTLKVRSSSQDSLQIAYQNHMVSSEPSLQFKSVSLSDQSSHSSTESLAGSFSTSQHAKGNTDNIESEIPE